MKTSAAAMTFAFVLLAAARGFGQSPAAPATPPATAGTAVLDIASYWRVHAACRDAIVPVELVREKRPDAAGPVLLTAQVGLGNFGRIQTAGPPADWAAPDFDDSAWFRSPGPVGGRHRFWYGYSGIRGLLSVRGKFTVNDPAAIKGLTVTLGYRGGVAVYLNGTEVARKDLPEGPLAATTPGAAYPREAYVDAAGKLIDEKSPKELRARAEGLRNRTLGPVQLPTALLRKGVNVLAVQVHRSDFRIEAAQQVWDSNGSGSWAHIEFNGLQLVAESPAGAIVPNVARPKTLQVWNEDPHRIFAAGEYGDPNEPLRPIRMVGARNGSYAGEVVMGSPVAIEGLKATVSDLAWPGGAKAADKITASQLSVSFAVLSPPNMPMPAVKSDLSEYLDTRTPTFLGLEPQPPARVEVTGDGAAVQPVWLAVRIPKDARPGVYKGTLTLTARGLAAMPVPVEVEVIDWTLPDSKDWRTYMGIYQSPETLAMRYKVDQWSEKHWQLMEQSYELLGELGCKLLVIPLINRTQFGNPESYVPWVRQKDGSYQYDFTVFDRLLDLAQKHLAPDVVSVQVWNSFAGGYHTEVDNVNKPTFVTVVDAASGKREAMQLPAYGSEEANQLWRPLMAAVIERLKKRGLDKKLALGIHTDNWTKECWPVSDMFKELAPGAGWHSGAHNRCGGADGKGAGGIRYVLREYMYVPPHLPDPRTERRLGWNNPVLAAISQRLIFPTQPPMMIHTMAERGLLLGDNGAGRIGLDYWSVVPSRSKTDLAGEYDPKVIAMFRNMDYPERPAEGHNLFGRFAESTSGQRDPHYFTLAFAGQAGPVHSINSVAMRQGVQECEARIFIEEALAGKKVAGELADRCQKLLDVRADFCRIVQFSHGYGITQPLRVTCGDGWQKMAADLFRLAGEVAAATKQ